MTQPLDFDVSTWPRCPHCGTFPETADGGLAYPGRLVCALHLSARPDERGRSCPGAGMPVIYR